jgi:ribonuclease Z
MNIKFLGKWSSNLIRGERNVSFVLDDKYIFDFGPHSLEALLEIKLDPNKIQTVFITHMHLDHYAGVAELLWYRSIYRAKNRLTIVGPKGIRKNTHRLTRLLHTPPQWFSEQIDVNTDYIEDQDSEFVKVFHSSHTIPCTSYRIEYRGRTIFYSGDTGYSEKVVEGAKGADYLIHELTYADKDRKSADLWGQSTWSDAIRVFDESGAKKLVPVHLTKTSSALVRKNAGKLKGLIYPPDTLKL